VQAAQERAIVDAAPEQDPVETWRQRQLADPQADLVMDQRALGCPAELEVAEERMGIEAAQVAHEHRHQQRAGFLDVSRLQHLRGMPGGLSSASVPGKAPQAMGSMS